MHSKAKSQIARVFTQTRGVLVFTVLILLMATAANSAPIALSGCKAVLNEEQLQRYYKQYAMQLSALDSISGSDIAFVELDQVPPNENFLLIRASGKTFVMCTRRKATLYEEQRNYDLTVFSTTEALKSWDWDPHSYDEPISLIIDVKTHVNCGTNCWYGDRTFLVVLEDGSYSDYILEDIEPNADETYGPCDLDFKFDLKALALATQPQMAGLLSARITCPGVAFIGFAFLRTDDETKTKKTTSHCIFSLPEQRVVLNVVETEGKKIFRPRDHDYFRAFREKHNDLLAWDSTSYPGQKLCENSREPLSDLTIEALSELGVTSVIVEEEEYPLKKLRH
jgi:hypothetical protein